MAPSALGPAGKWTRGVVLAAGLAVCCATGGCIGSRLRAQAELPEKSEVRRERLVIHSNFPIAQHHRLLDELVMLHDRVVEQLALPDVARTIHIYLFETASQYRAYVDEKFPSAPERRACFVHDNDSLSVYAQWSDFVAVDLRHEVTHGYLHALLPDLPLWLDEGIAEYFEVDRDARGFNLPHRRLLQYRRVEDNWRPDLQRLESVEAPSEMGETHYAESWAWVHYLLRSHPDNRQMLQDYLARLRMTGEAPPMSDVLAERTANAELQLLKHLRSLQP